MSRKLQEEDRSTAKHGALQNALHRPRGLKNDYSKQHSLQYDLNVSALVHIEVVLGVSVECPKSVEDLTETTIEIGESRKTPMTSGAFIQKCSS